MQTLFIGQIVTQVSETNSTNELAATALKKSKVIEGTAFRADFQNGGKGQRGKFWESDSQQNLLVSYVLQPSFLKATQQFSLIKAVSLAVKDLLEHELSREISVKWPNDIYVNDLKIAGILIESALKGSFMGSTIIGIGLNVNQELFSFAPNPTSIILETGQRAQIEALFEGLSFYLERRYLMLKKDFRSLDEAYHKSLFRREQWGKYLIDEKVENMKLHGVNSIGQLQLEDESNRMRSFSMHEVKMVI